uniref:Uncharacterized protein n=1 Tax=Rhizophora mucronata TaxID=61149 RepID=A0A2P2LLT7_RHIMU
MHLFCAKYLKNSFGSCWLSFG